MAAQTVSLKSHAGKIDAGHDHFTISGYFGGVAGNLDSAGMEVTFRDKNGNETGDWTIGFKGVAETGLYKQAHMDVVPVGSRSVYIQLVCDAGSGPENLASIDNVSLTLTS